MAIYLKKPVRGLVAAVVFGAVCGVLTRALMSGFALLGRQFLDFSWSGTLSILLVVTVLYVPGAVLLSVLRGPWRAAGHVLLAASVVPHAMQATGFFEDAITVFWSPQRWAVSWALLAVYLLVLLGCWYGIARVTKGRAPLEAAPSS